MNAQRALALLATLLVLGVLLGPCGPGSRARRATPVTVLELPEPDGGSSAAREQRLQGVPPGVREAAAAPAAAPAPKPADSPEARSGEAWSGPHVTGRAVDRRGRVLAEREVGFHVVEASMPFISRVERRSPVDGRVRTDRAGRFRIPVETATPLEGLRLDLRDERDQGLRGYAFLPWRLEGEVEHEVGDVLCVPPVDLARGRVIDAGGRPIKGATVSVSCTVRPVAPPGDDPANYVPYERNLPHSIAGTDAAGQFVLTGDSPTDELVLHAEHEDYQAAGRRCLRGDGNVVIALRAGAGFAGRVLLDPGIPREHVQLLVHESEPAGRGAPEAPAADGTFGWRGLHPGPARIEVRLGDDPRPHVVLDDVVLLAGQQLRDPRLDPLDLRGRLAVVDLLVVDATGAPQRAARAAALGHPARSDSRWRADHSGRIRIVAAKPLDLRVHAPGVGAAVVRGLREDGTVTLEAGRDIVCAVELFGDLREDERLRLELIDDSTPGGLTVGSAELGADLTATVRAAYDGRLRATLWLLTDGGGFLVQGTGTTQDVEVRQGAASVQLRVDDAALDRARALGR